MTTTTTAHSYVVSHFFNVL